MDNKTGSKIGGDLQRLPDDPRDFSLGALYTLPKLKDLPSKFELDILGIKDQKESDFCFPRDAKVLIEDLSYKNICDLHVGDYVMTHLGIPKKIKKTYKRIWQGNTFDIKIKGDYRKISCTPDHPFFVVKKPKRNKKGKWLKNEEYIKTTTTTDVVPAKEIKKGDYLVIPKTKDYVKDTTLRFYERDKDFLWVLGLYLAEGSLDEYRVRFSLHYDEIDIALRVKKVMERFGANVHINRTKKYTRTTVYVSGNGWVKTFLELGNKYSYAKKINTRLMMLEPELQMSIVEGVADGDGCFRKNRIVIGITSYDLLVQIRRILLRNGMTSSFRIHKKRDGRMQAYSLEYYPKAKRTTYLEDENNFYVLVVSVEKNTKGYWAGGNVYNIEVEDDNSYIVNDIATHNCSAYASCYVSELQEGVRLEPSYSFALSKELSGNIDGYGQDLRSAMKAHVKFGAIEEKKSPYSIKTRSADFLRDIKNWEPELKVQALYHKKGSYLAVESNNMDVFDTIRATIWKFKKEKRGVVSGVQWDWSSKQVMLDTTTGKGGGHAICYVGWDGEYLKLVNSYGKEAGDNGFHWVHRDVVNKYAGWYGAYMFVDISPEEAKFYLQNKTKVDVNWVWQFLQTLIGVLSFKK